MLDAAGRKPRPPLGAQKGAWSWNPPRAGKWGVLKSGLGSCPGVASQAVAAAGGPWAPRWPLPVAAGRLESRGVGTCEVLTCCPFLLQGKKRDPDRRPGPGAHAPEPLHLAAPRPGPRGEPVSRPSSPGQGRPCPQGGLAGLCGHPCRRREAEGTECLHSPPGHVCPPELCLCSHHTGRAGLPGPPASVQLALRPTPWPFLLPDPGEGTEPGASCPPNTSAAPWSSSRVGAPSQFSPPSFQLLLCLQ